MLLRTKSVAPSIVGNRPNASSAPPRYDRDLQQCADPLTFLHGVYTDRSLARAPGKAFPLIVRVPGRETDVETIGAARPGLPMPAPRVRAVANLQASRVVHRQKRFSWASNKTS